MNWLFDGIRVLSADPVYDRTLKIVLTLTIIVLVTLNAALIFRVVRNAIELRRARIRRKVEPRLMEYLQGDLPEDWILEALRKLPPKEVRRLLDAHFRLSEGRALDKLAILYLRLKLDSRDVRDTYSWSWWKRASAVRRLALLKNDAFKDTLRRCTNDKHDLVRIEAARGLAHLGDPLGFEVVCSLIDGPSRWQALLMAELADSLGKTALNPLQQIIRDDPRPYVRANAVDALTQLKQPGAIDVVRPLLHSPDPELRVRAVKAAGALGDGSTLPDLVELSTDDVWQVRAQVAKSLGRVAPPGDPEAIEVLKRAMTDKSWWVRYNAAHTLMEMGARGAEILAKVSATSPDAFARDMSRQVIELHELEPVRPNTWGKG